VEVSRKTDRKVKEHASHSNFVNPDRRGRPAMAGESFHSHGWKHQVHLECRRRDRRCLVAPQCIWAVPLPVTHQGRLTPAGERNQRPRKNSQATERTRYQRSETKGAPCTASEKRTARRNRGNK